MLLTSLLIAQTITTTAAPSSWVEGGRAYALGRASDVEDPALRRKAAGDAARSRLCGFVEGMEIDAVPSLADPQMTTVERRCDAMEGSAIPAFRQAGDELWALATGPLPEDAAWLAVPESAIPKEWWKRKGAWTEGKIAFAVGRGDRSERRLVEHRAAALLCDHLSRRWLNAEEALALRPPRRCKLRGVANTAPHEEGGDVMSLAYAPIPPELKSATELGAAERKKLAEMLASDDARVRKGAWELAGAAGVEEVIPRAFQLAWDFRDDERAMAVEALRPFGAKIVAPGLAAFDDPKIGEQTRAIILVMMRDAGIVLEVGKPTAKARAFVAENVAAWHERMRDYGRGLIALFPPSERDAILADALAVSKPAPHQVRQVLEIIGDHPSDGLIKAVAKHASDKPPELRAGVAAVLGRAPQSKLAKDTLAKLAKDKDPAVREAVAKATAP